MGRLLGQDHMPGIGARQSFLQPSGRAPWSGSRDRQIFHATYAALPPQPGLSHMDFLYVFVMAGPRGPGHP